MSVTIVSFEKKKKCDKNNAYIILVIEASRKAARTHESSYHAATPKAQLVCSLWLAPFSTRVLVKLTPIK